MELPGRDFPALCDLVPQPQAFPAHTHPPLPVERSAPFSSDRLALSPDGPFV